MTTKRDTLPDVPAVTGPPADPFETADFYTTEEEAEDVNLATPGEVVCEWAEILWREGDGEGYAGTVRRVLADGKTVTVYAYKRWAPDEGWIKGTAESLVERLVEYECEELTDPNADDPARAFLPGDSYDNALFGLRMWLGAVMSVAQIWHCEQVAQREYTAEEAIAAAGWREGDG
jgi:hypothetical protein